MSNREKFIQMYITLLAKAVIASPKNFDHGLDKVPQIAENAVYTLSQGTVSFIEEFSRQTAKDLGICPTLQDIRNFLQENNK